MGLPEQGSDFTEADSVLSMNIIQHGSEFSGSDNVHDGILNKIANLTARNVIFNQNSTPNAKAKYPIFTVPSRNPNFVGRQGILDKIERAFVKQEFQGCQGVVAIAGMGGVGKSQIAIEYCHLFKERHPEANIVFAHADSGDRLVQEYSNLAERLAIPGLDSPRVDILALVAERLMDHSHGRWLLVLDGADNRNLFSDSASSWSFSQYIPQSGSCSILITTKDKSVNGLLNAGKPIEVGCLENHEAEELLRAKLIAEEGKENDHINEEEEEIVATLLNEVGNLPLAIIQAGAFIQDRHTSLKKYVDILQRSLDDKQYLLSYDGPNSVLCAFQLSFDQAAQLPLAIDLLSLMAVVDSQGFPRWLLRMSTKEESQLEARFVDALGKLISLSLLSDEGNGETFAMHRLAQLAVREWLKSRQSNYHERAVAKLARLFPTSEYKNWKECRVLFPHAKAVLEYDQISTLPYAELLHKVARYQWQQEKLESAQIYAEKAYNIRSKLLVSSKNSPHTSDSLALLASVLAYRGFHVQAEEKHLEALNWRKRVLGRYHLDTLDSMNELGLLFRRQRRYAHAEKVLRQALGGRHKILPENNPGTLAIMDDLGVVLSDQQKYKEAIKLHQEALNRKLDVLGREHPWTLTSMEDLASVLSEQGDIDQARDMYRQTLELYTELLGEAHSDTVSCKNNLACVLIQQGEYAEAEGRYGQVVEAYRRIFGRQHQYTLTSLQNLSRARILQGNYVDAETACRDALTEMESSHIKYNPTTLICRRRLADILRLQTRNADAEQSYRTALQGWENRLMDDRQEITVCVENLIEVLRAEGKDDEADRIQMWWSWPFIWYTWALGCTVIRNII